MTCRIVRTSQITNLSGCEIRDQQRKLNYASKATISQNPEASQRKQILAQNIFSIRNENTNENSGQGESVFERNRCHYRVSIVVMQRRNTLDLRRDPVVQGSIGINGRMGFVTCLLFRAQRVSRAPETDARTD